MDVVTIIKMIAELGVLVVIAGVFIYLAFKSYTTQQKKWSENFDKQQKWLESFINQVSIESRHPSPAESESLDVINTRIQQELAGVLDHLHADRVYIFLYHNGGSSTSGLSFTKMSCACEVVSQGIAPVSNFKQNLYRSSYATLCNTLKEKGCMSINSSEEYQGQDEFLYQELVSRHASSAYFKALKDVEGYVEGFIGVDFCSDHPYITGEEVISALKASSLRLSTLVDVRNQVKR